jgi:transcriptional regulator with XRE-family HTH domain
MPAKRTPQPQPGTFADRLNRVWSASRVPKNKAARDQLREDRHASVAMDEPSYEEVSDFINRRTGKRCSAEYLGMLRRGARDNPTVALVDGLAEFFRVHRDELLGPSHGMPAPASTQENRLPDRPASMAERLEMLYQRPGPNGQPVTDASVAEAIGENEYILRGIRTGQMPDVQVSLVKKLARYFDVPVEYLVADEGKVTSGLSLDRLLEEEGALAVALRVLETPESQDAVNGGANDNVLGALVTLIRAARVYDDQAGASGSPTTATAVPGEQDR